MSAPDSLPAEAHSIPEELRRAAMPSTALLRAWSADPANETCWGLDVLADHIERLEARIGMLVVANQINMDTIEQMQLAKVGVEMGQIEMEE